MRDVRRHNRLASISECQDLRAWKLLRIAELNLKSAYEKQRTQRQGKCQPNAASREESRCPQKRRCRDHPPQHGSPRVFADRDARPKRQRRPEQRAARGFDCRREQGRYRFRKHFIIRDRESRKRWAFDSERAPTVRYQDGPQLSRE